jgi:hypothetical protein
METQNTQTQVGGVFPFKLEDLKSWTVHRKDGTVTKFMLVQSTVQTQGQTAVQKQTFANTQEQHVQARVTNNYGSYCSHKPNVLEEPYAQFTRPDGSQLNLWVASVAGARATKDNFDYMLDFGDIFEPWQIGNGMLEGDKELIQKLSPYTEDKHVTRLLKIDWDDRKAPKVEPEFWVELNKYIKGDVTTACIGGHGRSGSGFVCLLMVNAPDYDALDAIIHLRAVHCPRAIESQEQHAYIDKVAVWLDRKGNSAGAQTITDYKEAFKASTKPTAIATRVRLGWDK